MSNTFAWSIPKAERKELKTSNLYSPGPGNYDAKYTLNKENSRKYGIGSSLRAKMTTNNAPGPGNYEIKPKITQEGNKYTIGVKNQQRFKDFNPGPGNYNPLDKLSKHTGPSYAIGAKINSNLSNFVPGPGSYESQSQLSSKKVGFGNEQRGKLQSSGGPGPGQYDKISVQGFVNPPNWGFGTSQQRVTSGYKNQRDPGPGNYEIRSNIVLKNGGKTMSQRYGGSELGDLVKNPGPGSYNPNFFNKQNILNAKIGKEQQRKTIDTQKAQTPGPGSYTNCQTFAHKPNQGNTKIGKSNRRPLNETWTNAPGPGAYNPSSKFYKGIELSFKGGPLNQSAYIDSSKNKLGPGNYNPSVYYTKPRPQTAKIGTSTRGAGYKSYVPGPGAYYYEDMGDLTTSHKKGNGPYWGFGTEQQRPKIDLNNNPGPGNYNLPSKVCEVKFYIHKLPVYNRPQSAKNSYM